MEKPILTWSYPSPLRRLIAGALATLILTLTAGCASSGKTANAWGSPATWQPQAIIDAAPPAAMAPSARSSDTTRTDPSSGLAVDMGNHPLTRSEHPRTDGDDAGLAAGTPTDPLRPDATLNFADASASQDLWERIRRGFAMPDLDNALVVEHERWYAARPDYVQRMTQRGSRYLYHVVEELSRRQMPMELALLPFIESAFNPQALSTARASGMWQFTPQTGKDFELKQNIFRDDRRDVLASTRAALDYLQRLYRQFGDWQLALAAYNWGEGNVQRAIAHNQRLGLPTDYLSLNMPDETRNYVPKLYAVRHIVMAPEHFGLSLPALENHPYFVSVPIQRDMDAALAAKFAGMGSDDFKALNPSQNKPVILAAATPQLLLPYDNASQFMHNLEGYKGPLASWTAWQVPKTMRPADAAKRVGMSELGLRELNQIPPKMLVKAGSTLLVPRSQSHEDDVSENLVDHATMALAPDQPPLRRIVWRVSRKDSVAMVARRYHVSAQSVAQWNHCSPQASWHKGQLVTVFVQQKARTPGPATQVASAAHGHWSGRNAHGGTRTASHASHLRPSSHGNRIRVASAR